MSHIHLPPTSYTSAISAKLEERLNDVLGLPGTVDPSLTATEVAARTEAMDRLQRWYECRTSRSRDVIGPIGDVLVAFGRVPVPHAFGECEFCEGAK